MPAISDSQETGKTYPPVEQALPVERQ